MNPYVPGFSAIDAKSGAEFHRYHHPDLHGNAAWHPDYAFCWATTGKHVKKTVIQLTAARLILLPMQHVQCQVMVDLVEFGTR